MAAVMQTIAIVDRSNKVVSTTKQLKNVLKEAKLAYMERKAEIVAERKVKEEKELRKAIKAVTLAEEQRSETSRRSRKHHSRKRDHGHHRQARSPTVSPTESVPPVDLAESRSRETGPYRSAPTSPTGNALQRRATDLPLERHQQHPSLMRSQSTTELDAHVDMDLAYGEFHPESLVLDPQVERRLQKQEMSSLVTKAKLLLDEANCAQHSVRAIIMHLQKNPDAMAAVALTLAEISNLATKMAPGALAAFKAGAPGVFAMLAAPEFLIAVGAGVGITVVMIGGYKIVKKIKARVNDREDDGVDEMLDIHELDRIEHWRRGIVDTDTASVTTSVEGEYITPAAASMNHLPPIRERRDEHGDKGTGDDQGKKKRTYRRQIEDGTRRDTEDWADGASSGTRTGKGEKVLVKVKKPGPLRRMFTSRESDLSSRR